MKRVVVWMAAWVLAAPAAGWGGDAKDERSLGEILKDKGVLTEEEYEEAYPDRGFQMQWDSGLRVDSNDGRFKLKLGGRIQNDWALMRSESGIRSTLGLDDVEAGTEFRRARIAIDAEAYGRMEFKAEYDFADGDAAFEDVYLGLTSLPAAGGIRIGHFKEPFSLEELTSSKYITFLERALPNAIAPSRNTGVMLHDAVLGKRMTWAAGAFRNADDFGDGFGGGSDYDVTARLTGLPWYQGDDKLLHVGFSYSHQFRGREELRYSQRPEAHLSPARFVDTSAFDANAADLINPEIALVLESLSLQAEYMRTFVDAESGDDPEFHGGYVQASFFLTGEHRNYKTSDAAFDRLKPKHDFLDDGGCGAWEIAARYSRLDLDDESFSGGELEDVTGGINWYLNPNFRVLLNYVWASLDDVDVSHIFQTRFQVDF